MAEFGSSQLQVIQDAVDAISNTGIVNLTESVSGLGWWSKYSRIQTRNGYNVATFGGANVYGTVLNVTGKGFISKALFSHAIGGVDAKMKITVDGVNVIHAKRTNGSATPACGFITSRLIIGNTGGIPYATFLGSVTGLSYYEKLLGDLTIVEADSIYTSVEPIMFNKSLKVELAVTAVSGTALYLDMEYGVMA